MGGVDPFAITEDLELIGSARETVPGDGELPFGADFRDGDAEFVDDQADLLVEGVGDVDITKFIADSGAWIGKRVRAGLRTLAAGIHGNVAVRLHAEERVSKGFTDDEASIRMRSDVGGGAITCI